MKMNNRFKIGSGVYVCRICKNKTRETGSDESSVELCAYCNEQALLENEYYDGHITYEKYRERYVRINNEYKRMDYVKIIV